MTWRRVLKSVQALLAHGLLFCFTLLLVLKLDHFVSYSWWYFIYLFVSFFVLRSLCSSNFVFILWVFIFFRFHCGSLDCGFFSIPLIFKLNYREVGKG